MPAERGTSRVRRMSRDYHWYSPVLKDRLQHVVADMMVSPRGEAELVDLVRYCVSRRIPITPRGGGTEITGSRCRWRAGSCSIHGTQGNPVGSRRVVRAGAGAMLKAIDDETRKTGWELRLHPSTWKTATIGGFVGGGSTGCGAINYGGLADPGNLLGLRLLTAEEEPRFIELRGADLEKAIHAYGATASRHRGGVRPGAGRNLAGVRGRLSGPRRRPARQLGRRPRRRGGQEGACRHRLGGGAVFRRLAGTTRAGPGDRHRAGRGAVV